MGVLPTLGLDLPRFDGHFCEADCAAREGRCWRATGLRSPRLAGAGRAAWCTSSIWSMPAWWILGHSC